MISVTYSTVDSNMDSTVDSNDPIRDFFCGCWNIATSYFKKFKDHFILKS